jgi:hypothetical protein
MNEEKLRREIKRLEGMLELLDEMNEALIYFRDRATAAEMQLIRGRFEDYLRKRMH